MAYTITEEEPDDNTAKTATDDLVRETLANAEVQELISKLLSASIAETNSHLKRQIAELHKRLDRVLLKAAPVRTEFGRRRDY